MYDKLIMNVSCNLRTLGVNLVFQVEEDSSDISIGNDSLFQEENADRLQKDKQYKKMIFDMYKEVYARTPELFAEGQSYGLSPLGAVFAELFDEMTFDDHMICLQMLGSYSIDNYTEEFIEKLYENYSQHHRLQALQDSDVDKFIRLAENWPKFLQNNVLLTALSTIDASNFNLEDQSRVLNIQTFKNLVNPRFVQSHFNQFIKSSDKDQVKNMLTNFLQSIAYVGFTDGINMSQVT